MKTVLITGVAGFIGSTLAKRLSSRSDVKVIGIDNINDYYDVNLKLDRIAGMENVIFIKKDLNDRLEDLFDEYAIDVVVNLAAQAGVRYAKQNPDSYIKSNVDGFYNLIKVSQEKNVKKFLYASSSSVYGSNGNVPYSEDQQTSDPMSLYAASKISNEAIAASYYYSYGLQTIGMRFFSVYGPWGRPDMAYFKWANLMSESKPIELYDNGEMWRDMTYVEDVVYCIAKLIDCDERFAVPEVFNIGNDNPVKVGDILHHISKSLAIDPVIISKPKGPEEAVRTWANTDKLAAVIGPLPKTDYHQGLDSFVKWYKHYYGSR